MWKRCRGVVFIAMAAGTMASCNSAAPKAAAHEPEAQQVVSAAMKELYMAASAAAPHSPAQQKVILRMAGTASNGKELMLVMRAAEGVFTPGAAPESQVRSIVAARMMELGTLDQMIEYATQYPVNPESTRPFVQRMFRLAGEKSDPRVWYRIRVAAFHLKVADLERQAQTRGDELAGR